MDLPDQSTSEKGDNPSPSSVPREDAICFGREDCLDGDGGALDTVGIQSDIFSPERKDCPVHVWDLHPLWTDAIDEQQEDQHRDGIGNQGECNEDTGMGFSFCPNRDRIRSLLPSLGQLRRIGAVGVDEEWTEEIPKTPCCALLPHNFTRPENAASTPSQEPMPEMPASSRSDGSEGGCDHMFMVVDVVDNESDCRRLTESLGYEPFFCTYSDVILSYCEMIKPLNFDHIIILARNDFGLLFMDCYGRVFRFDDSTYRLWALGGSLEEAMKNPWRMVEWVIQEDMTVIQTKRGMQVLLYVGVRTYTYTIFVKVFSFSRTTASSHRHQEG